MEGCAIPINKDIFFATTVEKAVVVLQGVAENEISSNDTTKLSDSHISLTNNARRFSVEDSDDFDEGTDTVVRQTTQEIQLETPLNEENSAMEKPSIAEKLTSNVIPKRLSDEFSNQSDECEEEENQSRLNHKGVDIKSVPSCSSSSKTSSSHQLNDDFDENISEPTYISEETSSCSSLCYTNNGKNNFQEEKKLSFNNLSIDAIEREDFENEQRLTGGIIIRGSNSQIVSDLNRLNNIDLMNGTNSVTNDIKSSTKDSSTKDAVVEHVEEDDDDDIDVIEEIKIIRNKLTSTPTSSRNYQSDPKIRSSKQNLSISIEKYSANVAEEEVVESTEPLDEPMKSVKTESAHHTSTKATTATKKDTQERKSEDTNYQNLFDAPSTSKSSNFDSSKNVSTSIEQSSSSNNNSSCIKNNKFLENQLAELQRKGIALPDHLQLADGILDPDNDEDTWADCEEGSDTEEICTCRDYTDEDICSSEDELPSKDVDLSSYTQLDSMSDDILQDSSEKTTPKVQRKRKLTEQMINNSATESPSICMGGNRKRLALESVTTPRSNVLLTPNQSIATPKSASSAISERRLTPRLIPSKDNPAPELMEWLMLFNRWTNAERIWAIDRLIEHCEPTQVRHMMKVIEPQFQRDFISLLPKELALQVLSYLDPKDLLRAAQTCRSWRFLADDNLLWKDKCKHIGIISKSNTDKPKRGRTGTMPPISSPWKAAYMRHHTIEMNWRSNPVRSPKVLKGHDDHVITCLQFCGNRIVSGSDDNTLKVWSAVSGKCLRTLIGHTGGVWSSQMSGHSIISGSTDRTLKVWNAETGQCIHTLYGHTSTVRCMHLHGNKVVSGSRDATLRVWDIIEGSCLHILVGHLAAVRCVQYDGKLVVSGAYDYMVKVWNPERQECLHTLQGHTNRVYSLQFDGVHVVSGSLDTSIRVWEAETGSLKHTLMGHQSLTSGMELKNNILVSGNADSTVKVWDILSGQLLSTLSGRNKHHSAVTCLQFNTRFVITSSDDGTVKLWDVKTGEFIRNLVALDSGGSGGVVWRIRANDTKLICAVGSRNGTEETKLMVLDFDVIGACSKCSNIL